MRRKIHFWVWRIVIGIFALLLLPLSLLWLIFAIVFALEDWKQAAPFPFPFVPLILSAWLQLFLMTSGMVSLWWLVFQCERLPLQQIASRWWIGLIGGTSIAVYWLVKFTASHGENDEYAFVGPIVFVLAFEVLLLIRMCFNPALTPPQLVPMDPPKH